MQTEQIKITHYTPTQEGDGEFHFSNGAKVDYTPTNYQGVPKHRLSIGILMDNNISADELMDDAKQLEAMALLRKMFPVETLEVYDDETLEYVLWIPDNKFTILKLFMK